MRGISCLHQWCTPQFWERVIYVTASAFEHCLCMKDPLLKGSELSELTVSINMQQALCLLIFLLIARSGCSVLAAVVVHI